MLPSRSTLPASPSLEHLKHQARDLRKAYVANSPEAVQRVQAHFSPRSDGFALSEAQLVIAREHGFPSWPRLKSYLDRINGTGAKRHRPLSPDLDYYQGRAEGMVTAFHDGMPEVRAQINELYPLALEAGSNFDLAAAREVIAREHAFTNWRQLRRHLDALRKGETVEPFIVAFQAIEKGDIEALRTVLRQDPSLARAPGTNGNNLLGLAASFKRHDMVRLLLAEGADVDSGNRYGWTALHQAGYSNNVELAQLLLDAGAAIDISGRGEGGTPLVAALFWGNSEVADVLAASGVEPRNLRAAAGVGRVDLIEACFSPDGSLTKEASAHRGFYRPHGGFPEWTPGNTRQEVLDEAFVYGAKSGRIEALEALLKQGANIDADPYRGTALTWAAYKGRVETLGWLLENGAAVNQRGTFGGPGHGQGITALHLAAQCGRFDAVKFLLAKGANPTLHDELYGGSAAGWANNGGHQEITDFLLKIEASFNGGEQ